LRVTYTSLNCRHFQFTGVDKENNAFQRLSVRQCKPVSTLPVAGDDADTAKGRLASLYSPLLNEMATTLKIRALRIAVLVFNFHLTPRANKKYSDTDQSSCHLNAFCESFLSPPAEEHSDRALAVCLNGGTQTGVNECACPAYSLDADCGTTQCLHGGEVRPSSENVIA